METIDIYYAHWPDDNGVPLAYSCGAFAQLVREGAIKHWAVSNFNVEQGWARPLADDVSRWAALSHRSRCGAVAEALAICDAKQWPRPVMLQPPFSLVKTDHVDDGLFALCAKEGIAVCP